MADKKMELQEIVGEEYISDDPAILDKYSRDVSFVSRLSPRFVVKPEKAEELQNIVKWANDTLTPLVPVSSGPPHFRGDTVPSVAGAVIVDLSRMKKIIRVDRLHRVTMAEPGVTFGELIPAIEKAGLRLNMPLLPRQSKAVVGSLLEREPVTMPKYQWDIADPLACMEVVFGTGDMFRTGQAAGPGTVEEQWAAGGAQKEPQGPGVISWHRIIQGAQGTVGIATWASIRCEILPKLEEPFFAGSSQLGSLLELTHWLIRLRLANECFILNNSNLAAIMADQWPQDYQTLKQALPPWILFFNVVGYDYFPEEKVDYQVKNISEMTQRIGVEPVRSIGGVSAAAMLRKIQRPSAEPYWKLRYKGACQDIFFLTVYEKLEGLIETIQGLAYKAGYPAPDIGTYLQPAVQGTNCHCEFNLFYNTANPGEPARVKELSSLATQSLIAKGAFFSRPYGEHARTILNRDAATSAALTRIKTIIDPHNIMNPGKLCF
jgi:FAD/FMN-containing dehydrogenase